MFNLLKADFYKLKKSKAFLFSMVACLGLGAIHMLMPGAPAEIMGVDSGLGALELLAINFHPQIFVAFIVVFVTAEFQLGTIKNTISRGISRRQIYLSKFIVTNVATVVLLLIYVLIHVVFGTIRWGFNPYETISIYQVANFIGLHLLFVIAYTAFFMLIAILFRHLAGALVTGYLYIIMIGLLFLAEVEGSLIRYELHWNVNNFGIFEPTYPEPWHGIIVALAWIVISLILGVIIFKKQDIK